MEVEEIYLLKFLKKSKRLVIPEYQKPYSWTKSKLWDGIVGASTNDEKFDSIVSIKKANQDILIIDGQKKITEIFLFLAAFADVIDKETKDNTLTNSKEIRKNYLFSAEVDEKKNTKLILTKKDKKNYNNIIAPESSDEAYKGHIIEHYKHFCEKIEKRYSTLEKICENLQKMKFINISVSEKECNPKEIFKELNSPKLALSQIEIIRYYIFIVLELINQERLSSDSKCWLKLKENFVQLGSESISRFFEDYLTIKTAKIKENLSVKEQLDIKDVDKEIFKYSNYYLSIASKEPDEELEVVFKGLRKLNVDASYPWLLQLYDDYESKKIGKEDFKRVCDLVESYIFRRYVCGFNPSELNTTFAFFYQAIDEENYLSSVENKFKSLNNSSRYPSDEEFIEALKTRNFYKYRRTDESKKTNVRKYREIEYLLEKIENYKRDTISEFEMNNNYQVEHIMPQTLNQEWQEALHDKKEAAIEERNRLGNLTLIEARPNSEMSNELFKRKKEIAFTKSELLLNKTLCEFEKWTLNEMEKWRHKNIEIALKIWKSPCI